MPTQDILGADLDQLENESEVSGHAEELFTVNAFINIDGNTHSNCIHTGNWGCTSYQCIRFKSSTCELSGGG